MLFCCFGAARVKMRVPNRKLQIKGRNWIKGDVYVFALSITLNFVAVLLTAILKIFIGALAKFR